MGEKEFRSFLKTKRIGKTSQDLYVLFFKKIECLVQDVGELNQEMVNGFLSLYPHQISRATLKNYFEFKGVNFKLPKRTGRPQRKEITPMSPEQLNEVRDNLFMMKPMYAVIFDLTLACALRRQEVLNIKANDILEDAQPDKTVKTYIKITKAKNGKERVVFLSWDDGGEVLNEWLYKMGNDFCLSDYIFKSPVRQDAPLDKSTWNKAFRRASGKKFHPHLLRHARGLQWYEKGLDIVRIQQRLGHEDITTTRRYINPDAKKEIELWSKE